MTTTPRGIADLTASMGAYSVNPLPDYLLQIELPETKEPTVSRLLSMPATSTFHDLHLAIQVAFGWENLHDFAFDIVRRSKPKEDDQPWKHSYDTDEIQFTIEEASPQSPTSRASIQSGRARIAAILEGEETADSEVLYQYDLRDGWMHSITLIGRANWAGNNPDCVAGQGRCPFEYVGGRQGWQMLKDSFKKGAETTAAEDRKRAWYETEYHKGLVDGGLLSGDGGPFFWEWDREAVNEALGALPEEPERVRRGPR